MTAACSGASPAVKQPQRRAAVATRGHVGLIVQSLAKIIDVEMLVMTHGGYERTEAEFAELFGRAGLRLARVVPTESPVEVLEAVRA